MPDAQPSAAEKESLPLTARGWRRKVCGVRGRRCCRLGKREGMIWRAVRLFRYRRFRRLFNVEIEGRSIV